MEKTSHFLQRELGLIDIWNTTLHAWPVFSNHKHFFTPPTPIHGHDRVHSNIMAREYSSKVGRWRSRNNNAEFQKNLL